MGAVNSMSYEGKDVDYGVHTIVFKVKVPCQLFKRKEFTTLRWSVPIAM
jgi:hypothetical protein